MEIMNGKEAILFAALWSSEPFYFAYRFGTQTMKAGNLREKALGVVVFDRILNCELDRQEANVEYRQQNIGKQV